MTSQCRAKKKERAGTPHTTHPIVVLEFKMWLSAVEHTGELSSELAADPATLDDKAQQRCNVGSKVAAVPLEYHRQTHDIGACVDRDLARAEAARGGLR